MANKAYTAKEHQQAFEIWMESRNYARITAEMGLDYSTSVRWQSPDYRCPFNCPWHNWDKLIEEREVSLQARFELYENNILDPIAHDEAVRKSVGKVSGGAMTDDRRAILDQMVRSDFERLAHFEYLWSKCLYHISGQALDMRVLVDLEGNPLPQEQVEKLLGKGLKFKNLEAGIRSLKTLREMLDDTKERLGLQKPRTPEEVAQPGSVSTAQELSIDDLRHFTELLQNTPPEKQKVLMKLFQADESVVAQLRASL